MWLGHYESEVKQPDLNKTKLLNDNYELLAGLIKYACEKHLLKFKVKYNKKKNIFFLNR